jgi:hypothetical protein
MHTRHLAIATTLACLLGAAQADTRSFSASAIALEATDWSSFADLQQFDPAWGTLQQVTLTLAAELAGSARAESKNNMPSQITLTLQATLALSDPGQATVLVQSSPLVSKTFAAAAKDDNSLDDAGPAGIRYDNLAATATASASFTDSATLALFTGSGSVKLPFTATGASVALGSGNYRAGFSTLSGGQAEVTYTFAAALVPEPASWALLLAGLGAAGWRRARPAA